AAREGTDSLSARSAPPLGRSATGRSGGPEAFRAGGTGGLSHPGRRQRRPDDGSAVPTGAVESLAGIGAGTGAAPVQAARTQLRIDRTAHTSRQSGGGDVFWRAAVLSPRATAGSAAAADVARRSGLVPSRS